ncbi:MAG: hypothetical protein JWO57_80 [Pseudonocardiales bacterium]|nr:hypothetical protein [Pseudonocardiales bacterium]
MDAVGMRLDRTTILLQQGHAVGCNIYSLQNSPLQVSEHLPGPNQPAIQVLTTGYHSAVEAHNALALAASATGSTNPQQVRITGADGVGVCFQTAFAAGDKGKDWACGLTRNTVLYMIRTVVLSPALNVVELAGYVTKRS